MSTTPSSTPAQAGSKNQDLYRRAQALIPGGTQLLSKRPERFVPGVWPPYYRQANGCEVIDLDGHRYLDMSIMAIGTCVLGYNDPDVSDAVIRRIQSGSMCSLNCPEEVDLAELLIRIHPWAQQVRYVRTGGEAMAVAVRIARARTGRDLVAFCGYHGWHDWYLSANLGETDNLDGHLLPGLAPSGVPRGLKGTALPFKFNRIEDLENIVRKHGDQLAAVTMEPTRTLEPEPGFLERVRELADQCGAVLVFDEITIGLRLGLGGSHLIYGVNPDLAVFGKSLGNGFPMAAVIGTADVMSAAEGSFISSSYWTDGIGPTAALATLRKAERVDLPTHIRTIGTKLRDGLLEAAERHKLPLTTSVHPAIMWFKIDHPQALAIQTLWTKRMLERDILGDASFYPALSHTEQHVNTYLEAINEVFPELAQAIEDNDLEQRIGGPLRQTGFARLTS